MIAFNPGIQNQRPGLLLVNGLLYIAWGSHNDRIPYHGWVMAYTLDTLKQVGVFITTPEGYPSGPIPANGASGIWMSGGGLAADSGGNVYVTVGNGSMTVDQGGHSYANAFLKFGASSSALKLADYFEPFDALSQNLNNMEKYHAGDNSHAAQMVPNAVATYVRSSPAYWNGTYYTSSLNDHLKAFT